MYIRRTFWGEADKNPIIFYLHNENTDFVRQWQTSMSSEDYHIKILDFQDRIRDFEYQFGVLDAEGEKNNYEDFWREGFSSYELTAAGWYAAIRLFKEFFKNNGSIFKRIK